jgi:tetratricopeptide (TPR) repeat protein
MANPRLLFRRAVHACRLARIVAVAVGALTPVLAGAQVVQAGEPRVAQLLAAADDAWRGGRFDEAFARYEAVLQSDSTSPRAVFRVATMLAWRNDLGRSESMFRLYLRLAPGDDDGRIGLARTLAWAGRYEQSVALCDSMLTENAKQRDAALLAAQARAWSGKLRVAINRYRNWLSRHPNDAEAWMALAQTWQWADRPDEARNALDHALAVDPGNAKARTQLDWVNVARIPSVEPAISSSDDSDDNRSTTYMMRAGFRAPWQARLVADGSYRVADLGARHGTAASLRAASSFTPLYGQWTVRGELGATRLEGSEGPGTPTVTHVEPLASVRLSGRVAGRLSLGAGASRAAFDETAPLIQSGIATTSVDGDGDLALTRRLTLGGGGGWTQLSGGSGPNSRVAGSGALRWTARPFVSFAIGMRGFSYDHAAFDGYFAPKRYLLAEASSRLRLGGELGWGLESELGLGNQTITAFDDSHISRFAQRANASVLYRPAPGAEWSLSGGFANVASPATISSADYRYYTVAIKGRVRL